MYIWKLSKESSCSGACSIYTYIRSKKQDKCFRLFICVIVRIRCPVLSLQYYCSQLFILYLLCSANKSGLKNNIYFPLLLYISLLSGDEGCLEGDPAVHMPIQFTPLLDERAGVAPDVTCRFSGHKGKRIILAFKTMGTVRRSKTIMVISGYSSWSNKKLNVGVTVLGK